jgi:hypothetical protein
MGLLTPVPDLKNTENELKKLNDSLDKLNKSTRFSSWAMIVLTIILVISTAVLIYQDFK